MPAPYTFSAQQDDYSPSTSLSVGWGILTMGQYLQPKRECLPVARFVPPEEFDG